MRLNKYTIAIPNNNKVILYNLITKMMVEVDSTLIDTNNFFYDLNDELKKELLKGMIISEDSNDDYKEFIKIKNYYNNSNYVGTFMIHLGYDCNLSCSYCYQTNIESNSNTDLNTRSVVEFIYKLFLQNNYSVIDIGGEPLLYVSKIEDICEGLRKLISDNIRLEFSIVTNGTMLNNNIIQKLIKNNIYDLQITLDGIAEIHDVFRYYKNKKGTFYKIMENIENISKHYKKMNIAINCNLSKNNYKSIPKLLEYLKVNNINFPIFFSLVFDVNADKNNRVENLNNDCWLYAHKIAIKYNYKFLPFYRDMYLGCAMTRKNYFVIGADGNLYKCINAVNNKDYFVSSIKNYNLESYNLIAKKFHDYQTDRESCKECELYPICYGGCHYINKLNGFVCSRSHYETNDFQIIKEIVNAGNKIAN